MILTTTIKNINNINIQFVAINNDYLRVNIIDNQVVEGLPVKELRDLKAINSRLKDLIYDLRLLQLSNMCTKEIKRAISFLSYHKRQTILNNSLIYNKRSF